MADIYDIKRRPLNSYGPYAPFIPEQQQAWRERLEALDRLEMKAKIDKTESNMRAVQHNCEHSIDILVGLLLEWDPRTTEEFLWSQLRRVQLHRG